MGAGGGGSASAAAAARSHTVVNAAAFVANVGCSVGIVFVNKVLMDPKRGYGFTFACTLSAMHFLVTWLAVALHKALSASKASPDAASSSSGSGSGSSGKGKDGAGDTAAAAAGGHMPFLAVAFFAAVSVVSIGSLNLSLFVNPVGLYQIAKLLVIPTICGMEAVWLGRRFNNATLAAIVVVIVGVAVVTVNDLGSGGTSLVGVALAACSVVGSAGQQFMCGAMQRRYKVSSQALLAATAPLQGGALLLLGPFVDAAVSGRWVTEHVLTAPALGVLASTCLIAVGINVSQFLCLGRFSAVTFQVLGHSKTILVLLISWLALGETMTARKLGGMLLAVLGMVAYGYIMAATVSPAPAALSSSAAGSAGAAGKDVEGGGGSEATPLLRGGGGGGGSASGGSDSGGVVVVSISNRRDG